MNSTKEKIAKILIENKNNFISGEFISSELGISRASIWKHINSLRSEGFEIESKNKVGYKLILNDENTISEYEIMHDLNTQIIGRSTHYFKSIDSTNTYAHKIAGSSEDGTLIVAEEQTAGRGRTGRYWFSKMEEGLYFSLILKPEIPIMKSSFLTQVAGASLLKALDRLGVNSSIKWPNDIILNKKKISGILTEMSAEIDRISYIIIGIGINLYGKNFDDSISQKATSIENEGYNIKRLDFIKSFCEEFEKMYIEFLSDDTDHILQILRDRSEILWKEVFIIRGDKKEKVFAKDIDRSGNLIVSYPDGREEGIFTGEVSIRGLDSYV